MKRSPIKRRSALSRGSKPLKRSTLKRKPVPLSKFGDPFRPGPSIGELWVREIVTGRRQLPKVSAKQKRALAQLQKAKRIVRKRSGGWCEVEGCDRRGEDFHHVKFRSQGGEHTPENLRHLCRVHHNEKHP